MVRPFRVVQHEVKAWHYILGHPLISEIQKSKPFATSLSAELSQVNSFMAHKNK